MIGIARPEFSRPMPLAEIRRRDAAITVTADADECAALARRFGLAEIGALSASVRLQIEGATVEAEGQIEARLVQRCIATGDPLPVTIDERFALRFEPEPDDLLPDEEIELAAEDCDVMHYEGGAIDLGEAVAQTLLLSLDPYPRGPQADDFLQQKGVKREDEAGAFGALAALRGTLDKRD